MGNCVNPVLLLSMFLLILRTSYSQTDVDAFVATPEYERSGINLLFEYFGKNISACDQAKMLELPALAEAAACDNALYMAPGGYVMRCPESCSSYFSNIGKVCAKAAYTTYANLNKELESAYSNGKVPPVKYIEFMAKSLALEGYDEVEWYSILSNPTEYALEDGSGAQADFELAKGFKEAADGSQSIINFCYLGVKFPGDAVSSATGVFAGTCSLVGAIVLFVFLLIA